MPRLPHVQWSSAALVVAGVVLGCGGNATDARGGAGGADSADSPPFSELRCELDREPWSEIAFASSLPGELSDYEIVVEQTVVWGSNEPHFHLTCDSSSQRMLDDMDEVAGFCSKEEIWVNTMGFENVHVSYLGDLVYSGPPRFIEYLTSSIAAAT